MKFEKIRKINKSKIIIGGLIGLGVLGAITILPSYSKYRNMQSFNLVKGKITYKQPDLNVVAMYISEDGESYIEHTGRMPSSEYVINESQSYCNLNEEKDTNVRLYTNIAGEHIIHNLIKGNKCYLYFDKQKGILASELFASIKSVAKEKNGSFTGIAQTTDDDTGLFSTEDPTYGGTTYYYRGLVTNNYVSFANKCWRIIRINGNDSIRIIYDGNTCHANGENADSIIQTSIKYNNSANDNAYVGYMYGETGVNNYNRTHANTTDSNIKTILDSWYTSNIADAGYASDIDQNAGFCNDRSIISGNGYGNSGTTYYGLEGRVYDIGSSKWKTTQTPTLGCTNETNDLFTSTTASKGNHKLGTRPIGLITADEVIFAGGFAGTESTNYWLYNGKYYWTMTPASCYSSSAIVFNISASGLLYGYASGKGYNSVNSTYYGVRPVLNLSANTRFQQGGDGTISNPYEVI